MSADAHRQAEILTATADQLVAQGRSEDARALYFQAAEQEALAFGHIPVERSRTRGIVAVSAVALYRRADAIDQAIRHAHLFLADGSLPDFAREQLDDLLIDARQEQQARAAGHTLGEQTFDVSMRGVGLHYGVAPLDTIVLKLQQIERYLFRVGEWVARKPFRTSGSVSTDIIQICTPMISEPSLGSFRFQLRLDRPVQQELPLFDTEPPLNAESIATHFFGILDIVSIGAEDELLETVTDPLYRQAFLRLVRNLVPDGKAIDSLEFQRLGAKGRSSAILTPPVRRTIDTYLAAANNQTRNSELTQSVHTGVLRALHLDKGWIILVEDGVPWKCTAPRGVVLDDVVEPLVNRMVQVTGHWTKGQRQFIIDDIAEAVESSNVH
jgi:hypothetical protein